jgi:hypothetical protein
VQVVVADQIGDHLPTQDQVVQVVAVQVDLG